MNQTPYSYAAQNTTRYTFVSKGKHGAIVKIVEFTPTFVENIFNLSFGDLLFDGTISDIVNSNNGDIIKVLSTVVHIIKDFTTEHPKIKIVFAGSTVVRTALYQRILNMYFESFKNEFIVTGLVSINKRFIEVPFETGNAIKYSAFFVKRNH